MSLAEFGQVHNKQLSCLKILYELKFLYLEERTTISKNFKGTVNVIYRAPLKALTEWIRYPHFSIWK